MSWQLKCIFWLSRFSKPVWRWALSRRLSRRKETPISFEQKLFLYPPNRFSLSESPPTYIWGHAVGVGELMALVGIFRTMSDDFPKHHFLLTSTSITSQQALQQQNLGPRFVHQFAPIDHPDVISDFLDSWQPVLACWSETDLWPCMLLTTHEHRIPMFLFNARLNKNKEIRLRRWQWFYQPLLQCFDAIYTQNHESLHHLRQLNLDISLADISGNIKALAPALPFDRIEYERLKSLLTKRSIWLLASSHEGEEAIAFKAHQMLLSIEPQALLVVVPRDVIRGMHIAQTAHNFGLSSALRTSGETDVDGCDVYIADTLGELGLWYALCSIALIGGSLVPIGGHNPYEAVAAHCRVLSGTHVFNFSESYEQLEALGWVTMVSDAASIYHSVLHAWKLPKLPDLSELPTTQMYADILLKLKSAAISRHA
jgi:3-deoxy-D-manno-octulosonic-acid transferase